VNLWELGRWGEAKRANRGRLEKNRNLVDPEGVWGMNIGGEKSCVERELRNRNRQKEEESFALAEQGLSYHPYRVVQKGES